MLKSRQRSTLVQAYAYINLLVFFVLIAMGLTLLAWVDALIGVGIYMYPRLKG